jgi:hypothetical protein
LAKEKAFKEAQEYELAKKKTEEAKKQVMLAQQ